MSVVARHLVLALLLAASVLLDAALPLRWAGAEVCSPLEVFAVLVCLTAPPAACLFWCGAAGLCLDIQQGHAAGGGILTMILLGCLACLLLRSLPATAGAGPRLRAATVLMLVLTAVRLGASGIESGASAGDYNWILARSAITFGAVLAAVVCVPRLFLSGSRDVGGSAW